MIDGLKPYPVMKDSGVPWLGQVPEHWEVQRLKSLADNVVDQTDTRRDGELYVALEHVESWTGRLRSPSITVEFASQVKRFRPSDVLFGKLRPYLAKVHRPTQAGVCVGEFLVLRPRSRLHSHFLEYVLRSAPAIDLINSWTFGAKMPRVEWDVVGNVQIALGPFDEQRAIVRFLDHADRLIRRYISAKRKLIRLLEEQKQAIIHRAVTRGLDPNVRLKPSGVEWLGDVPAHWEVVPLSSLGTLIKGNGGSKVDQASVGVPCVRYGDLYTRHEFFIRATASFVTEQRSRAYTPIYFGDVLFAASGETFEDIGRSAVNLMEDRAVCGGDIIVLRPQREVAPHFLGYATNSHSVAWQKARLGKGFTVVHIYGRDLKGICIPLPPLVEQRAIIDFLGAALTGIKSAVESAKREIALLQEYRTRLIADVVTGKLDVRAAAAALPEPQEAPDDLEAEAEAPAEEEIEAAGEAEDEEAAA